MLSLPPSVILLETIEHEESGWTTYRLQHVDQRTVAVYVPNNGDLEDEANLAAFIQIWADFG